MSVFIFAKRGPIQQSLPLRVTVTINRVRPLVTYNLKISLLPRHIYAVKSTRSDPKYFSDQWLYRPSFHSIPGPLNAAFSQLPSNGLIVRSPTLAKVTNYSVKFGHFQATRNLTIETPIIIFNVFVGKTGTYVYAGPPQRAQRRMLIYKSHQQ